MTIPLFKFPSIPRDFEIFAYKSTSSATTNTRTILLMLSRKDRRNPATANMPPIASASFGLILPEGIGRWGFCIASSFLSKKSERYNPAVQPIIGINNARIAIFKGGKLPKAMHDPAKLTSPHHITVYSLHVSKWAKSLSFMVNFDLELSFNRNNPRCNLVIKIIRFKPYIFNKH